MIESITNFLKSFFFAGKGIANIFVAERNMRVHASAALVVIACGIHFNITITEWCLVVICIGIVMTAEIFNSVIEYLTDLVKPEFHPIAGKVKDAAAGGVLVASVAAAVVGVFIFWKYF